VLQSLLYVKPVMVKTGKGRIFQALAQVHVISSAVCGALAELLVARREVQVLGDPWGGRQGWKHLCCLSDAR